MYRWQRLKTLSVPVVACLKKSKYSSWPPMCKRLLSDKTPPETQIPQTLITDFDFQISEPEFKDLSEKYLASLADHLDGLASKRIIKNNDAIEKNEK